MKKNKTDDPMYATWVMMKRRCYKPRATKYALYGGRGIKVCDRWLDSFWNFVDDMGERPKGTTLDRVDPDGDYEPSNCRWSTYSAQNYNLRIRSDNNSGHKGVCTHKLTKKWRAYLSIDGMQIHGGYYADYIDAVLVREVLERIYLPSVD